MMSNNGNPTKKRKANDGGRATTCGSHDVSTDNTNDGGGFLSSWFGYFSGRRDDDASSGPSREENKKSQLDRMENIMMRMDAKLNTVCSTVGSLESRCEQLETKCSSLESKFETASQSTKEHTCKIATALQSTKDHIDETLRYHEMLMQNQKWEYSARVYTKDEMLFANYDIDEANYIYETSQELKKETEAMRRGNFPEEDSTIGIRKGVSFHTSDEDYSFDAADTNRELSPHWREFAAALKQFKPGFGMFLSDDKIETFITFGTVTLNQETTQLVSEALMNMPFKALHIERNPRIHGGMSTIAKIMGNNKHLQKLDMYRIQDMDRNDISELCSAIQRHPSLVDVTMMECFSDGLGDEMLHTLLRTSELKLERLQMSSDGITIDGITTDGVALLSDYLATNPRLKELDLTNNDLDDSDAVSLANALRSNTSLRYLLISDNCVEQVGKEALLVAVRDESSLNSVAASNHYCLIESDGYDDDGNLCEAKETNRARKIYALLSSRNQTLSNVQHFDDIDLKLLPNILQAVQKYSNTTMKFSNTLKYRETYDYVEALSIVYEVMRRWDKVSPLYKSLGKSVE